MSMVVAARERDRLGGGEEEKEGESGGDKDSHYNLKNIACRALSRGSLLCVI